MMKKAKKIDLVKSGIIELQKRIVPEIELKKHFSKKFIKNISGSVIRTHLTCEYGFADSPLQDPLLFLIPVFAKDPYLAAAQLVAAIGENICDCDYDSNPSLVNDEFDEFWNLLQSMD